MRMDVFKIEAILPNCPEKKVRLTQNIVIKLDPRPPRKRPKNPDTIESKGAEKLYLNFMTFVILFDCYALITRSSLCPNRIM